jgi:hypothetical protein
MHGGQSPAIFSGDGADMVCNKVSSQSVSLESVSPKDDIHDYPASCRAKESNFDGKLD